MWACAIHKLRARGAAGVTLPSHKRALSRPRAGGRGGLSSSREFALRSLLCPVQASADWVMLACFGSGKPLLSLPIEMLISSRDTLTHPEIVFASSPGAP